MNLAYKSSLLIGSIFLVTSNVAIASVQPSSCGEIRLVHDKTNSSIMWADSINGVKVGDQATIAANEYRLRVSSGEHFINVKQKTTRNLRQHSSLSNHSIPSSDETRKAYASRFIQNHFLSIDIKPNKAYVFSLSADKKNLKLKKVVEKECDLTKSINLEEKKYTTVTLEDLSELHQEKLMKLTNLLATNESSSKTGRLLPLSLLTYFGVVVDDEYDDGAIQVLSVQPMSSAFKLGLRSGDKIIKFNRRTSNQFNLKPVELLEGLVNLLHYYDDMKLVIKRDGKRRIIEGKFLPILVPQAWIKRKGQEVTLTKVKQDLDWNEQLFYMEFLRELLERYENELADTERLAIRSKARHVNKLGLKGSFTNAGSMKLSYVDPFSSFFKHGIAIGEEIVSFGKDKKIPNNISSFTDYFSHLDSGSTFYVEIRNGKQTRIVTGEFEPIYYPEFEFVLDLSSVKTAEQNILLAYEELEKRRIIDGRHESRWKRKNSKPTRSQRSFESMLNYRHSTGPQVNSKGRTAK